MPATTRCCVRAGPPGCCDTPCGCYTRCVRRSRLPCGRAMTRVSDVHASNLFCCPLQRIPGFGFITRSIGHVSTPRGRTTWPHHVSRARVITRKLFLLFRNNTGPTTGKKQSLFPRVPVCSQPVTSWAHRALITPITPSRACLRILPHGEVISHVSTPRNQACVPRQATSIQHFDRNLIATK